MEELTSKARALMAAAKKEESAEKLRDAARIFRDATDRAGLGEALQALLKAEPLWPGDGLVEAADVFGAAKDMGSKKAEGTVLSGLANQYYMTTDAAKSASNAFSMNKSAASSDAMDIFNVRFSWQSADEAASLAGQAAQYFGETLDKAGLGASLELLAIAQMKRWNLEEAVGHARTALDTLKGQKGGLGVLSAMKTYVTVLANCHPMQSLHMLEVAREGVAYFKEMGDKQSTAAALHLVAAVQYATFTKKSEPKEARKAAEAALAAYQGLGDSEGQASVLRTVIYAGLSKGQLDEALRGAKDLQSLCAAAGDRKAEAKALVALANIQLAKDNARKALKLAQEALAMVSGDVSAELEIMGTLMSVYFMKREGDGALNTAQDILAIYQKNNDREGEAAAMVQLFRVYQLLKMDDEALKAAYDGLSILKDLMDQQGQLRLLELICSSLLEKKALAEAMELAQDALGLARELGLSYCEGNAMFIIAKTNIASQEGLSFAHAASSVFRESGYKEEAAICLHAVANGCLLMRAPPTDAIAAAADGLTLYKELDDKRGEAVMMHTIANCQLAMRETENAVNTAYEAMRMFQKAGDNYGRSLARKLLLGAGQSEEAIKEWSEQTLATFDGAETKQETDEERRRQEDEARDLQDSQVLWELAWIPWETQDPKNFGEKHPGGTRRIFVAGEMMDKSMLARLVKVRPPKSTPSGANPYFSNLLNGRLLNKDTLQFGMTASQCTAVVYDVSKLNRHGPLEVIDLVLKLVQAFVPIEERKVGLDMVTSSCMNLAYTGGIQEPFHGTLWGFSRAARNENPMHEFRLLDIDPGRRQEKMPFICRYLLGAQATRPAEALMRDKGVMVSRLVGARSKLNLPVRIELDAR